MERISIEEFSKLHYWWHWNNELKKYCIVVQPVLNGVAVKKVVKITGYVYDLNGRNWVKDGISCSREEVFDALSEEEKEEELFDLDQWK